MDQNILENEEPELELKLYNELGNPEPRSVSWLVSGAAFGFVVLSLHWSQIAATGWRFARLQDAFSTAIVGRGSLESAVDDSRYKLLFDGHRGVLRLTHPLFGMIEHGELSRALQMLEHEETPKHPLLIVMAQRLRPVRGDDVSFQKLKDRERFAKATEENLWNRYVETSIRAAELLSVKPPSGEVRAFKFYESGVLAGLPVLPAIPDGIESFEQLKNFSFKLREIEEEQRVAFEGEIRNAAEISGELAAQVLEHQAASTKRASTLKEMGERLAKATREARLLAKKFARELTRQTVDPEVRSNYAFFREVLERYHIRVPELLLEEGKDSLDASSIDAAFDKELAASGDN